MFYRTLSQLSQESQEQQTHERILVFPLASGSKKSEVDPKPLTGQ